MDALTRRGFLCGSAAIAALSITPAVAATGVKTLTNGKTEIDLKANSALNTVGGVVELDLKKYGKIATQAFVLEVEVAQKRFLILLVKFYNLF